MSLDSNQNVISHSPLKQLVFRFFLAIGLSLVIALVLGALAWSSPYGSDEIRAAQTSDEAKIQEIRNQEITQLRITLGRRVAAARKADLYIRLAEIYLESYRATFLLEGRVHEKRLADGRSDTYIDRSQSKPYLAKGIQACNEILSLHVPYNKYDEVYYFLGFYNEEMGNKKESIRNFDILAHKFPSSRYVVEAQRELGDYAYDNREYRKAEGLYEQALTREKDLGSYAPRLLHKLAWTYYRTKQYDRAIETMKNAIARASGGGEKYLSLKEEALRDMAIFMTERGRVEEAIAYFQGVAGDKNYYPKVLEKLGRQYERNVETAKAVEVYETLMRTAPNDEAAFRVRVKLVDLDLRQKKFNEALLKLQGVKIPSGGEIDTQTSAQNLKAMIRRTATENHELFRKHGNRNALTVADEFYTAYLNTVLASDDPRKEKPEIQMYLADVKRELGKSSEASALYRKVLDTGDKRYAKEAGALWTASLADAIKKQSAGGAKPNPDGEPSKLEKEFVEAADDLQNALGDTPEGREAALRSAQVLAGYKASRGDAIKRSKKIIQKWPKTPQALTAARLWLQLKADMLPSGVTADLVKSSEADDLKDAMKEVKENSELMAADAASNQGKLAQFMADQENRFKVGSIARKEKDKDFASAGKEYETYAAEAKKKEVAEKAYESAISSYVKVDDYASASKVADTWLVRFPNDPKVVEPIRAAASEALIQGHFQESAQLFEKIGRMGMDGDALEAAARLHEGNGNVPQAQACWRAFLEKYKKSPNIWSVTLALARSQELDRQDGEAAKTYKSCLGGSPDIEAECGARLADLYMRAQDPEQAKNYFRRVAGQKGAHHSPFVGYARYKLADFAERSGHFDALQLPESQLKTSLAQRVSFLQKLTQEYQSVVEAGGPWGVAALERLAQWVWNFADEVEHISPPAEAKGPAIAQFQKTLLEISAPLRKRAVDTWADAYRKASQSDILSPSLPTIVDRLADAKASTPHRAQGVRGKFRLAGLSADGGADGRTTGLEKVRERLEKNHKDASAWVDYGNLLWGQGKALLARIAYEQALGIDHNSLPAMNNRGVVLVTGSGEEDWLHAAEALAVFGEVLKRDDFYASSKANRALLFNYYRLFARAKPLWDQINVKAANADSLDGSAIAEQGMGSFADADTDFGRASDAGAPSARFARLYHEAARAAAQGAPGGAKCLAKLSDLDSLHLEGFEREAAENLKRTCGQWKSEK